MSQQQEKSVSWTAITTRSKIPINAFNRLSEELSSAYFGLAERAAGLEAELARSRRVKERQREEKEPAWEEKEHLAERLAALLDSLPGGVVVYDSGGLRHRPAMPLPASGLA